MKRVRKTAEERQMILATQESRGLSNEATATEFGVSVASLNNWRRRGAQTRSMGSGDLIEVTSLAPTVAVLKVQLSNGIRLEASLSWPLEHLGRVAKLLSCL